MNNGGTWENGACQGASDECKDTENKTGSGQK